MLAPIVHSDHCTGCGVCEHACVTRKASIFILPRSIAMGESSARYIKGWEEKDEERLRELPEETVTITLRSEKKALSMVKVRHDKNRCTLCGKCIEVCPEVQVLLMVGKRSVEVISGECTNCGRCIEVCDEEAMKFGLRHVYGK